MFSHGPSPPLTLLTVGTGGAALLAVGAGRTGVRGHGGVSTVLASRTRDAQRRTRGTCGAWGVTMVEYSNIVRLLINIGFGKIRSGH